MICLMLIFYQKHPLSKIGKKCYLRVVHALNEQDNIQKDLEILQLGTNSYPNPSETAHWLVKNRAALIV
jgi:hypothetical protein